MVSILVNNLKRLTRIGARSVEWGRIKTEIPGYKLSDREELSAYDLVQLQALPELDTITDLNLPDLNESYERLDLAVKKLLNKLIG